MATAGSSKSKAQGVVGQQPVLRPGARFEYTSGCPLTTPSGLMQGAYRFEDETGGTSKRQSRCSPSTAPTTSAGRTSSSQSHAFTTQLEVVSGGMGTHLFKSRSATR